MQNQKLVSQFLSIQIFVCDSKSVFEGGHSLNLNHVKLRRSLDEVLYRLNERVRKVYLI